MQFTKFNISSCWLSSCANDRVWYIHGILYLYLAMKKPVDVELSYGIAVVEFGSERDKSS